MLHFTEDFDHIYLICDGCYAKTYPSNFDGNIYDNYVNFEKNEDFMGVDICPDCFKKMKVSELSELIKKQKLHMIEIINKAVRKANKG